MKAGRLRYIVNAKIETFRCCKDPGKYHKNEQKQNKDKKRRKENEGLIKKAYYFEALIDLNAEMRGLPLERCFPKQLFSL